MPIIGCTRHAARSSLSDPMTGFFGIRADAFKRAKNVSGAGFKIALELYVKCGCCKPAEVPFSFGVRVHGESKARRSDGEAIIATLGSEMFQACMHVHRKTKQ